MSFIADRVYQTATNPGSGSVTPNASVAGYQTFSSGFPNGSKVTIAIENQTPGQWEICESVWNGTTLTRGLLLSSSTGSRITFTGAVNVFSTASSKYHRPVWDSEVTSGSAANVVLDISSSYNQFFTGDFCDVTLPDVTTIPLGYTFHIINQQATQSLIVYSFDATAIFIMPRNVGMVFTCVRNTAPDYTAWTYATVDLWSNKDGTGSGNSGTTGTGATVLQTGASITSPTITTAPSIGIQNASASGGLQMIRNSDAATNSTRMYLDSSGGVGAIYNGNGSLFFNTNATVGVSTGANQFRVAPTASAVNYVQVTGAATNARPAISAQGSDTNIALTYNSKGAANHVFATNSSNLQFVVSNRASSVNWAQVSGGVAGSAPIFQVEGSDTNIDLALTPKGTGSVVVNSPIRIDTHLVIDVVTATTSATTADQVLATFDATIYRTIKLTVQAADGTNYQSTELLAVHNGTTVNHTEYGTVTVGSACASYTVDYSSATVRLRATPASATATTYRIAAYLTRV